MSCIKISYEHNRKKNKIFYSRSLIKLLSTRTFFEFWVGSSQFLSMKWNAFLTKKVFLAEDSSLLWNILCSDVTWAAAADSSLKGFEHYSEIFDDSISELMPSLNWKYWRILKNKCKSCIVEPKHLLQRDLPRRRMQQAGQFTSFKRL